jgi:isoleucyl-tRNA synthetase
MYEAVELEERITNFWKKEKVYEKIKEMNKGKTKFYFCDGPPYATGQIHPGTAWNKCIKDSICRYKRARGFDVRDQPGYDTHGLPIEVKVEQELKLKSKKDIKKIGIGNFIKKCKKFATQYIGVMSEQFKRLGCWFDWENYYVTYTNTYIEAAWKTIKKAYEKNLLDRGEYVLPLCPRCETAIANYELEYDERDDPSIYIKFKVVGKEKEYLIVWTTTPWTLVGNIAVMVHPNYQYVKAKVEDEVWIIAKDRLDAVVAVTHKLGLSPVIIEEFSGAALKDIKYEQPLADKVKKHLEFKDAHKVVMSDRFVTLEEGTGLVHTAPGHGPQDFEVGKQYNLPIFCPVGVDGKYTKEAGEYSGLYVKEADPIIIDDLRKKGLLINAGIIKHRYPHCWRCKTQLIFITTNQWFIRVTKEKEKMLSEIEKVSWQPDFARVWFKDFVSSAPDWCISRQRYWGIPLPIWICEKCEKIKVIESGEELKKESGSELEDLHKPDIDKVFLKCECGGKMKRVSDVLDVWFDSGNAIWAPLSKEEFKHWYPCDFIVEGKDQIRGWFYSLLGSGIVLYDEVPYRSLLMHGHFVDEKGEKMSKSVGNFVPIEEIIGKYGADTFRLWSLSNTTWEDLKFNWDEIKETNGTLSILWNIYVFLDRFLALEEFSPEKKVSDHELEDEWLISRLNSLVKTATESFDNNKSHEAIKLYKEFIAEDLSRFYIKIAKKRIADGRNKKALYKTLYDSLLTFLKLSSPVIPFINEEIYQKLFKKYEKSNSIHTFEWPGFEQTKINQLLEKQFEICKDIARAIANARQAASVKLRWPLEEAVIVTDSTEHRNAVERLPYIIEMLTNIKRIKIGEEMIKKIEAKPNFNSLGPAFKEEAPIIAEEIKKQNQLLMKEKIEKEGSFEIASKDKKYKINKEMVEFVELIPEGYSSALFNGGKVYLKTKINEELYNEAIAREVARRIQIMRKEIDLVESDLIRVNVIGDKEFLELLEKNKEKLVKETRAKELILSEKPELKGKSREWEIEEGKVQIIIKKQE